MNWQNKIYESITEAERPKGKKSKRVVKDITGREIPSRTGNQFSANTEPYDQKGDQSKRAASKNAEMRDPEGVSRGVVRDTIHGDGTRSRKTGELRKRRR